MRVYCLTCRTYFEAGPRPLAPWPLHADCAAGVVALHGEVPESRVAPLTTSSGLTLRDIVRNSSKAPPRSADASPERALANQLGLNDARRQRAEWAQREGGAR